MSDNIDVFLFTAQCPKFLGLRMWWIYDKTLMQSNQIKQSLYTISFSHLKVTSCYWLFIGCRHRIAYWHYDPQIDTYSCLTGSTSWKLQFSVNVKIDTCNVTYWQRCMLKVIHLKLYSATLEHNCLKYKALYVLESCCCLNWYVAHRTIQPAYRWPKYYVL